MQYENDGITEEKEHHGLSDYAGDSIKSGIQNKISDKAGEIYSELSKYFSVDFDDAGSIGKRYRREDEIGTPICITYDFESENDGCVTVRDRDTMEQVRIPVANLKNYIEEKIAY